MRKLLLATVLMMTGLATANAQCFSEFSPQAIADALTERGYRAEVETTEDGDPVIRLGMQGNNVSVYLYDCTEGGTCTGFTLRVGFDLDQGMSYE
ncbi:MAG: YbjN domain-containing protein, partial [Alphaproteobacteria bacterium]